LVHKPIFFVARCDIIKGRITLLDHLADAFMQVAAAVRDVDPA
jgi:hypothetical protein